MKSNSKMNALRSILATALLGMASLAHAGGPLAVCTPGQPFLWPGGGANVPYNPDQGNLGILSNAQATAAVDAAFGAWAGVPTATINYTNAGQLPVDVDITNFVPFLQPAAPDGLSAIVFDDTGEIFAALFGPGSGVLGFAGPEWLANDCTILEGLSFLNGPAIGTLEGLLNLMVHEFGHYSNLAHTEVNGQLFIGVGDTSGPGSSGTFGPPPFPDPADIIETMYPFLFGGIDQRSRTPHADDAAILSRLYPQPDYAATTGAISGSILLGVNGVTGANVIARNVNDPFFDAVSAISSDFTDDFSQSNPFTGAYTITGLTPGESYAVYIDEILAGGFSTPLSSPLPGPEEFYNGANESSNAITDIPTEFEAIMAAAGSVASNIDIEINLPPPGSPLPTGDDGTVQIPLPFPFCFAGKAYNSAFINGNGYLTLDAAATGLTFIESVAQMLNGPPRIAGFWDDLDPSSGGSVYYNQTGDTFSVTWDSVPEFFFGGSNTVTVTLTDNSDDCVSDDDSDSDSDSDSGGASDISISYGELTATDGLSGVSAGLFATNGVEPAVDLVAPPEDDDSDSHSDSDKGSSFSLKREAAVYELFVGDADVAGNEVRFDKLGKAYKDRFEKNNSLAKADKVSLPFDTIDTYRAFSAISPAAGDIDFYRFKRRLSAGTTLVVETVRGQVDTVMALYQCDAGQGGEKSRKCDPSTAQLVAADDDGGTGLLSRIEYEVVQDGTYALAVTFCCDYDFDGVDPGQGEPFDQGRYVLDAFVIDGTLVSLTDESTVEIDLGFTFPYQGNSYTSVFVNSNGYLTFGGGEIFAFNPNVPDFENGLPRVAPLWVDLDPGAGGIVFTSGDGGSRTVTFMGVPEFFFGGSNNFAVTLHADGGVTMSYFGMDAPEGITGLAEGGGNASNAVDLSTSGNWPASGSTHEEFIFGSSQFDLDGTVLTFDP